MLLDEGEIGRLDGRSDKDKSVGSEDLVLCEEGL